MFLLFFYIIWRFNYDTCGEHSDRTHHALFCSSSPYYCETLISLSLTIATQSRM
ncbi:hypothetical protein [Anabaena azotica]|uniref:Uncharacterized protein n=1 Tax=Anabaena azotica FACHB-119 TaxID=947527 RepID=A0ABR8D405_9NOST|nr:hypothetical protein [Anabaena azotica]MBD2501902.1 hypothetical protein [Anabaena azotica FACHB-119]